ncbi:MAG: isochorismate synthase [Gammaproteobacteria bacterium]|jgi:menaquinone-specific isochorismate synthase|nr:isochorismate synthase [Gammaproteobacteria bacterium]MBT3489939.1 isochorismate synthase [Gammaproteobacteria bacterium]MBT3718864.1 isochorismate synthase [Gammaproteobacteria bacterium]MBT3843773.1 isochorismate synthase [Gammaproteobacteria bacterium]MBT3893052.1 isochorismate synthase [Gammaproteobacteria bacterium]
MVEQLAMELDLYFSDPPSQATLLSITLPFYQRPFTTPLAPEEGIYWNSGTASLRLLGLGSAWSVQLKGSARFCEAEQQLKQLHNHWSQIDPDDCGHAPQLYFQYAFDADDPMKGEWSGLPNTLLSMPRLQLINHKAHQFITLSHPISGSNPQQILARWEEDLNTLQGLLETPHSASAASTLTRANQTTETAIQIQQGINAIQHGTLEKIVWGEAQQFQLSQPLSLQPALQQLERRNRSGVQLLFAEAGKQFITAPPERLLKKQGGQIEAEALAGTVPRGKNEKEEQQLEQQLLQTPKLQHEHQLVADFIQQQLKQHCDNVESSATPAIYKLENVQHLLTTYHGQLKQRHSLFELTEALHQNPAICGTPQTEALAWLQQHHNSHRGYYCGGAGWIDGKGDGEIHVLLRCSLADTATATLFAGAGIVKESTAEEEQTEINLKIEGLLNVLAR